MAGALNAVAGDDTPMTTVPSMSYMGGNGGGPGSGGALSYMPGVDPRLLALMNNTSAGPVSPYAKQLSDTSAAILGDPSDVAGALSSSKTNYDKAVQSKMTAINRAMGVLSGLDVGQSNLPLMAAAAGALQPTRTGSIGETIGNSMSAAVPQIEKQRQVQEEMAARIANLGISEGDTGIAGAQGDEGFLEKRLGLANQTANEAGQIQARSDLAHANLQRGVLQYAGRIGAADVNANKNRYQYLGIDANDPTVGRYLDKSTNQVMAGPAVARPAAPSAAEYKYNIWLKNHPGDTAGALDFSSGHRTMPPEQMRAAALRQAQQELGTGADPKDVDSRARDIYGTISGGFDGPAPAAPPAAAPAVTPAPSTTPPPAHKMSQDDINQSIANARAAITKNPQAKTVIIQRLKAAGIDTSGL